MRAITLVSLFMLVFSISACKNSEQDVKQSNQKQAQNATSGNSKEKTEEVAFRKKEKTEEIALRINDRVVYKSDIGNRDINDVINDEIIYQTALIENKDKDPKVIQLIKRYKKNLIVGRYKGDIIKSYFKNYVADQDELTKYYEENKAKYTLLDLEQIIIKDKNLADKIHTKLKEGADMQALKNEYAKDSNDVLVTKLPEIKKYNNLFTKLEVGEIGDPVHMGGNYNIFKIKAVTTAPFKQVKRIIKHTLVSLKRIEAIKEFTEKSKIDNNIKVEIVNN